MIQISRNIPHLHMGIKGNKVLEQGLAKDLSQPGWSAKPPRKEKQVGILFQGLCKAVGRFGAESDIIGFTIQRLTLLSGEWVQREDAGAFRRKLTLPGWRRWSAGLSGEGAGQKGQNWGWFEGCGTCGCSDGNGRCSRQLILTTAGGGISIFHPFNQ